MIARCRRGGGGRRVWGARGARPPCASWPPVHPLGLDWVLAAAVLHVLLPEQPRSSRSLGAFVAAQVLGIVSHVPGGLGVFERPWWCSAEAGSLPPRAAARPRRLPRRSTTSMRLIAALAGAGGRRGPSASGRRPRALGAVFGSVAEAPHAARLLAVFTFLGGAVLLFSGATPASAGRLAPARRSFLPLAAVETSHFIGSLAGVGLLVLSQGIARRLDFSVLPLGLGALVVGFAASLLKGARLRGGDCWAARPGPAGAVKSQGTSIARPRSSPRASRAAWVAASWCRWSPPPSGSGLFAFRHVELFERAVVAVRARTARRRGSCGPRSGAAVALAVFGIGTPAAARAPRGRDRLRRRAGAGGA